jgi:hypothetical protein
MAVSMAACAPRRMMLQCGSARRAMRVLALFPVAVREGRETENRLCDHAGRYYECSGNTTEVAQFGAVLSRESVHAGEVVLLMRALSSAQSLAQKHGPGQVFDLGVNSSETCPLRFDRSVCATHAGWSPTDGTLSPTARSALAGRAAAS